MLPVMSTLAEIERAAEKLTPAQLAELVHNLSARVAQHEKPAAKLYEMRSHRGGLRPGIDPNKLGQLPDEQ
jgi:hypothetical protein